MVPGTVWPFVCIVIMCGALSGFHALIASGTTPKMLNKESDIRPIGYGGMLLEGFVSITALVAACALEPGDYFKINIRKTRRYNRPGMRALSSRPARSAIVRPRAEGVRRLAGEHRRAAIWPAGGRGGHVGRGHGQGLRRPVRHAALMAYWYHFVIMFEALFILTLLETGTRVARFVFQETLAQFNPKYDDSAASRSGPSTSP